MGADADLIRRLTEEGFLKGDPGVVDELMADDFVTHDPPPGVSGDKEGRRQIIAMVSAAFSDMQMESDARRSSGERLGRPAPARRSPRYPRITSEPRTPPPRARRAACAPAGSGATSSSARGWRPGPGRGCRG